MKLKRILALAVSLAMVLSIVPAFGLTASAASTTSVIDTLGGEVLWGCPDGSFSDTAIATAFPGWSSSITSGYVNVKTYSGVGNVIQYYVNGTENVTTITSPGYGDGTEEKLIIEWIMKRQNPSDLYFDFSFTDKNGTEITFLKLDRNYTAADTTNGNDYYAMGYPAEGTDCAIVAYNNADGSTHTVDYYVGGSVVATQSALEGQITGFGGITSSNGRWSTAWNHIGFGNLTIGAVYPATETQVEVTATYTVNNETVATATSKYDTATGATGVTFPAKYVYYDGEVYGAEATTLSASDSIEMTLVPHYASKAVGDTFELDGKQYKVDGDSVIVNGNFITGDTSAWTNRPGTAITGAAVAYDEEVGGNALTISTGGASATNSIGTSWNVTAGQTYYLSFYVGGTKPSSSNYTYNRVFQSDKSTEIVAYGANMTDGAWKRFETVFTPTGDTIYFQGSWASNIKYANVELLPVTEDTSASATVTVKYYLSEDANVSVKTATQQVIKGGTANFDAVKLTLAGTFYSADAVSYENVQADAEYSVILQADTTRIAPTTDFSYNFNTEANVWAGDNGFSSDDKSGTISIGWNNFRETIMTFPLPTYDNEIITGATLNVNVGYVNTSPARYVVYAIDPSYVDIANGTMNSGTGVTGTDNISNIGGVQVASTTVTKGENAIELDLSGVANLGDTLALLIYSGDQVYTYSATTDYVPYLSSTFTTVAANSYTVNYVNTNGETIGESVTAQYVEGTQYGYDDEVVFPNVAIPYFEGYVFKNKTVSSSSPYTVTLTYEAVDTNAYFFNNVASDTTFVSLNMLGAHNAFTSGISDGVKKDAAATAQGDSGAQYVTQYGLGSAMSQTQSADALTLLNNGVRYFDIRLSRSDKDYDYKPILATYTAPHTNGVFYTTHGMLSDEFRPIAYTIAQWAKAHPGEIIVLDVQEIYDYTGDHNGNSLRDTWNDMDSILREAGIYDYVTIGNASIKSHTYGSLTSDGTKANIVLFGRNKETAYGGTDYATVGNFILRGTTDETNPFQGRLYSNYSQFGYIDSAEAIGTSLSASYIQQQVDYLDNYHAIDGDTGDHPIVFMFRVMQAQSESSNLLNQAATDNNNLLTYLKEKPEWLTSLPVVMVNGVGSNTDDIVTLLQSCNEAQDVNVNYVDSTGATVATKAKSLMVGTLYTDEVAGGFITGDDGSLYYVTNVPVTAPSDSELITPVPYNSTISVNVEKVGNVYTWQAGHVNTGNLDDAGVYPAASNFGAFNWGASGTHDRVGVAILDLSDNTSDEYFLEGTEARFYGSLTAKLYVVSYEDYQAVDLESTTGITGLLTDERLAATVTSSSGGASKIALDAAVVKNAIGESGKVVVLGDAYSGLYGLAGEGLTITTRTLQDVTVSLVSNGTEVDTYETKAYPGEDVVVPAGIYAKQYYLLADTTASVDENGAYSAEVTPLGDVFTWQEGKVNAGNLDDAGVYPAASNFAAYNWGDAGSVDRLGFAVLSVTAGDKYVLDATQVRYSINSSDNTGTDTYFYAISYADYEALDLSDADAVKALLTDDNLVATINGSEIGNVGTEDKHVDYVLDTDKVTAAIGDSGKVVIIGSSHNSLYGLAAEGLQIISGYYTVTVYENGSSSVSYAAPGAELTIAAKDGIVAYTAENNGEVTGVYPTSENGSLTITVTSDITLYAQTLGVSLVDGAQVRIGAGVTGVEGGYKIDDTVTSVDPTLAGSGLRFIGLVDRTGSTLATVDGVEIGIAITAEGSDKEQKVVAAQYQDESNTVFTAAVVKLSESNYNRVFTAKPYVTVTVDGVDYTYYGNSVSRSIYEIAAGILVSNTVEGAENVDYDTTAQVVNNVLNAYVNQVGVRLNLASGVITARTEGTGAYVGGKSEAPEGFFDVVSSKAEDGTYSVTITAAGNAKIFGYWNEYIRLNNVSLSKYITASELSEDGTTLTLTINPNA